MSLNVIKKILWLGSGFLTLLLLCVVYMSFTVSKLDAQKIPEIPQIAIKLNQEKIIDDYALLWNTKVNSNTPPPPVEKPNHTEKENIPKYNLTDYLSIHSIISDTFAIVTLTKQHKNFLVNLNHNDASDKLISLGNKDLDYFKEIRVGDNVWIVQKIKKGTGILFKNKQNNQETWIKYSH